MLLVTGMALGTGPNKAVALLVRPGGATTLKGWFWRVATVVPSICAW